MPHVHDTDLAELEAILLARGMLAALGYLNARTPHRFTAIFQYDGELLINRYLFDRENTKAQVWTPFPTTNSFCSVVLETRYAFTVANSATDVRVVKHPARSRIASYCGVPLFDVAGSMLGSLCHFDHRPALMAGLDLPTLKAAAPLIASQIRW